MTTARSMASASKATGSFAGRSKDKKKETRSFQSPQMGLISGAALMGGTHSDDSACPSVGGRQRVRVCISSKQNLSSNKDNKRDLHLFH